MRRAPPDGRIEREPAARSSAPAPARPAAAPAGAATTDGRGATAAGLLALQRTAGNAAVTAMVSRQVESPAAPAGAGSPAVAELRRLLTAEDEEGAIAQMARLSSPEADLVLDDAGMRSLAVSAFGDATMARAMAALRAGNLAKRLRWMFAEGSNWSRVRSLLTDPSTTDADRLELYRHNDVRSGFTEVCDDDEMAEAVTLLGGTLEQRLNWMFVEGTSWKAVKKLLQSGAFDDDQRRLVMGKDYMREFFVDLCNDAEMFEALRLLRGSLEQQLRWLFAEGTRWPLLRALIADPRIPESEKTALYAHNDLRKSFTEICDDDQMAEAVSLLGGTLAQRLNWMFVEGTSWKAVRRLLADDKVPPAERLRLYELGYMRDFFVDLCGDAEMADAVKLIGGPLIKQLEWMVAEGFNAKLLFDVIRRSADDQQIAPPLPAWLEAGLKDQLSAGDHRTAVRMLTQGLLASESIDDERTEAHYELKDPDDPTQGYELQDFSVRGIYDMEFTRTALRVKVNIRLTGVTADAQHRRIWTDGIAARWNRQFRATNGSRSIPIVFQPTFVSSGGHHTVEIHPPVAKDKWREDAGNWYAGPNHDGTEGAASQDTTGPDTAAHEFGHLIGLADEYNLSAADYQRIIGTAPSGPMPASGHDSTSIMAVITGPVEGRHMRPFVDWLNRNRVPGEKPYRVVAGP